MNLNFLKSAFDRIGSQSKQLEQIAAASETTAAAVTAGGVLYTKVDEMVVLLRQIAENGMASSKEALKDAKVLGLVGKAMEPLGKGFQLVVAALNELPNADEATKKMDALVGGLVKLKDAGKSILQFAGYMILAAPLLMVAAIASPLLLISLFFITKAIEMVNNRVDTEGIEKFKALGDVGKSILLLSGSLALTSLIMPHAIKGALGAVGIILLIGGVFTLLAMTGLTDTIEDTGKGLMFAGLAILSIGVSLALFSIIEPYAMAGMLSAAKMILLIGFVFSLIGDEIERSGKGLIFAAGAILSVGISLALFNIILPNPKDAIAPVLVVAGVATTFGIIGIFGDTILKGAKAMGFAALAILGLGLSLYFFDMLVPGDILNMETFKAFIVIGAITAGFFLAGKGAKTIAQGAGAMIVAGIAMVVIGFGVSMLDAALPKENTWERIGQYGAIIGGLGVAMALAGAGAPFIAAGAGAMILAGVALLVVGAGIAVIAKVLEGGRAESLTDEDTGLVPTFKAIGKAFIMWPWEAAGILLGAGAMIAAGVALLTVGVGLTKFAKLANSGLNLPDLGSQISLMLGTLAVPFHKIGAGENMEVLDADGNKTEVTFGGGSGGLFGLGKSNTVSMGIQSVLKMGTALSNIAKGVQNMANLKFPTGFDKEGKPTGFETIGGDAFKKVITNTMMMVGALAVPFARIGKGGKQKITGPDGTDIEIDFGKKPTGGLAGFLTGGGAVQKGIKAVMNMGQALSNIAGGVQDMALLKFPTGFDAEGKVTGYRQFDKEAAQKVTENTEMLVSALGTTFATIGSDPNATDGSWWGGKSTIEKGIAIVTGVGEPLLNLAKGVQAMANLKFPIYDEDGKITGYNTIENIDGLKDKIGNNTRLLIQALTDTLTTIGKDGEGSSSWWQGTNNFEKGIEIVTMISEPYKILGESVKTIIESIGQMDSTSFAGKMQDIIGVFTGAAIGTDIEMLNSKKLLTIAIGDTFDKMGKSIPGIISAINSINAENSKAFRSIFIGNVDNKDPNSSYNAQKLMWNSIGIAMPSIGDSMEVTAGAINSMDLEKLTEARTMFEALAALTHGGDANNILSKMGESLETALENLAEMLNNFRDTVEEGNAGQQGALETVSSAVSSLKQSVVPTEDTNTLADQATPQNNIDMSGVVRAIEDLENVLVQQGIKLRTV